MKKYFSKILITVMIVLIGVGAIMPRTAQADVCSWWHWISNFQGCAALAGAKAAAGKTADSLVDSIAADVGNIILKMASWSLSIVGILLNASIILTLNIKDLYAATPAIEQTWIVIRDLSSIFIIFALLYASIVTILGVKGPQFKSMVFNIFVAGMLINFSLFFTRILIDASNLISLQFYRAIVPNSQNVDLANGKISTVIASSFTDGGLSDVFLQSLKIPKAYHNQQGILKNNNSTFLIAVSTIGGSILMFTAAFSFLFAALAFILRLALLMIIMGFCPIYFVGMIFPAVEKNMTSKFMGYFTSQLMFMPVYLLLMYAALMFISNGGFFEALNRAQTAASSNATSNSAILLGNAGLIFQYLIAFIFINIPLIAAVQLGGVTTKLALAGKDKVRGVVGGWAGRNTFGRLGRAAGAGFDSMAANAQGSASGRAATTVLRKLGISQAARGGLAATEAGKYGGKQNLADIKKEDKERAKTVATFQKGKERKKIIGTVVGATSPPTPTDMKNFRETIDDMNNKDFETLEFNTLKDPAFASSLSSKQTESLLDGDILTTQQKTDFKAARKTRIGEILSTASMDDAKEQMKKLSGKELAKLDAAVIKNTNVLEFLTPSQLLEMRDLDGDTKAFIGDYIENTALGNHKAKGYMKKYRQEWS